MKYTALITTATILALSSTTTLATPLPPSSHPPTQETTLLHLLPRQPPTATATAEVDKIMFQLSLPEFSARRKARDPSTLDWRSDACSWSLDKPAGHNFRPACERHDFGYRNFRHQQRFTKAAKVRIDDVFLEDMMYQCSRKKSTFRRELCRDWALGYFSMAREYGGDDAKG